MSSLIGRVSSKIIHAFFSTTKDCKRKKAAMLMVVVQWISFVLLSLPFSCQQFDLFSLVIGTIRPVLSR